ncbi:hypothetical protein BY458DRAFT_541908 [Sporodiniella umbellata]|nr:hypothetical protein BY458DRAFT_541908 [Sporodiniella umbellata]
MGDASVGDTSVTRDLQKEAELEKKRKEAKKIRTAYGIRSRCVWTPEEDQRLKTLYERHGPNWSLIASNFADRRPLNCHKRYELLGGDGKGPWKKSEVDVLIKLGEGKAYSQIDDWERIQKGLPEYRPLYLVKQKYSQKDPHLKSGRWLPEEIKKLTLAVHEKVDDWDAVASIVGTRSRTQCQERWRWQQRPLVKGHFTKKEDEAILEAVKKYGPNFSVIAEVIDIGRSPRHISQHYQSILNPDLDRSPWSPSELSKFYAAYIETGSAKKAKDKLESKRPIRDIWNHLLPLIKKRKTE